MGKHPLAWRSQNSVVLLSSSTDIHPQEFALEAHVSYFLHWHSFPKAFLFCWLIPFGNWFCSSVRSCFLCLFHYIGKKGRTPSGAKRIRKVVPGCLMPTYSELLNPCSCTPSAVPRLRPCLEEYCLQLEQLPGCVSMANTSDWGEGCHPCGGTGEVGRGNMGERKEGRDELRAPREWSLCVGYRWGTRRGLCGRAGSTTQTGTTIASTGFTPLLLWDSLCPKGPAPDLVGESSVCPKAARDEKVERRMCSQEKNSGIPQPLSQRTGGRRKNTEAAFTIFTSNKTSQGTILIAQSGPWVCEASPRWSGQEGLGLEGHQFFLRGAWDSSSF